jgi:hypothetical protein
MIFTLYAAEEEHSLAKLVSPNNTLTPSSHSLLSLPPLTPSSQYLLSLSPINTGTVPATLLQLSQLRSIRLTDTNVTNCPEFKSKFQQMHPNDNVEC